MMKELFDVVRQVSPVQVWGKVVNIVGVLVYGYCPNVSIGSLCEIIPDGGLEPVQAEVVGFRDAMALLMPFGDLRGLAPGNLIRVRDSKAVLPVGEAMLGRVLDAMGRDIDGKGPLSLTEARPIYTQPPSPMERERISEPLDLGIRSINGLLTCGLGQRVAIMAGSGVGKSTLLGMIARDSKATVNVIGLIGERGREVREFIENDLGPEGLRRSVVIVATSDQSPVLRMRGAYAATTVAEYFAAQGQNVLLMMDSVTRYAMANREIGLAVGEPPTTKGYPPSVFAGLPKFLERAGNFRSGGSITGLYTVLVEGDDMNEPVADTVRSILDGHIVLTRSLANKNHYPPIDVLQSSSRLMNQVVDEGHIADAARIQKILSTYRESEDLVTIGAYTSGTNRALDDALARIEAVNEFLVQDKNEHVSLEQAREHMQRLCA